MAVTEQFVKKQDHSTAIILVILYFVAAIGLSFGLYKLAGRIAFVPAPFLLMAAILAARYTLMMSRVEYEYSVNTGVLNIDAIYDQTKRKPIIQTNISAIQNFGKLSDASAKTESQNAVKVINCSSGDEDENAYYFVCPNENKGNFMYVFEPNESVIKMLKTYSPMITRYFASKQFDI